MSDAPPRRPPETRFQAREPGPQALWTSLVALGLCVSLVALNVQQRQAFEREAAAAARFRQARLDLACGFVHIVAADTPNSPFDHNQGLALLAQAIREFEEEIAAGTWPQEIANVDEFRDQVTVLKQALTKWAQQAKLDATETVELRLSMHQLETLADQLAAETRTRLVGLRQQQDLLFAAVMTAAIGLLAGIYGVVYLAGCRARTAEAARVAAEARELRVGSLLRALAEGTTDAIFAKDLQGRYQFLNEATARFLGKSIDEVVGRDDSQVFDAESAALVIANDRRILSGGETETYEENLTAANVSRTCIATKSPHRDSTGRIIGIIGISRDITDRKRAENEIREQQRLISAIAAASPLTIYVFDLDRRELTYCNYHVLRELGYRERDMPKQDWSWIQGLLHPQDLARFTPLFAVWAAAVDGQIVETSYRLRHADGSWHWFVSRDTPFQRAPDGRMTQIVGTIQDITDRVQALDRLQDSETRLRNTLDNLLEGCIIIGPDWRCLYLNPAAARHARLPAEQLLGRTVQQVYPGIERASVLQAFQYCLTQSEALVLEDEFQYPDGERAVFELAIQPVPEGLLLVSIDISARKQAEADLRQSERQFRELADAIPQIVWVSAPDGAMTHMNAHAARFTGVDASDLTGWKWEAVIHPSDLPRTLQGWGEILSSGAPRDLEFRIRGVGGRYRWHISRQVPLRDGNGDITQWFGTCTDIDDQKQAIATSVGQNRVLAEIAAGAPLRQVLHGIVAFVEDLLPDSRCSILLLDADGVHLRVGAAPQLPAAYNRAVDGVAIGPNVGSCGTAAYLRDTVIVGDIATDPRWQDYRSLAADHGLVACWSVPILTNAADANSKVLGTFAVYPREIGAPQPADLDVVHRAADLARVALEHERTSAALRESETKFRTLAEHFPDPIFVFDPDDAQCPLRVLYVSQAIRETHGYEPREVLGKSLLNAFGTTESAALAANRVARVIAGESLVFEVTHRHRDGHEIPMEVRSSSIPWGGRPAILRIDRDLTQIKQAQQHLQLLEASIARINDIVMITDLDYAIVYINEAFERQTGYRREEVLGRLPTFLHGPRTSREELLRIHAALKHNEPVRTELINYKRDGAEFLLEIDVVPIADPGGRVTHFAAVERDITERRRAEAELRDSEERLRVALSAAGSIVFVWDVDNDRVTRYANGDPSLPTKLVAEQKLADAVALVHPDDVATFQAGVNACLAAGNTYRNQFRIVRPGGAVCWIEEYGTLTRHPDGRPQRLTGISIDVTERKQLEDQLRHSQKMEAIGQLAGGIAHDFNNLITVIRGYGTLLQTQLPPGDAGQPGVREILRTAQSATDLVKKLLAFGRKQPRQLGVVDLHDLLMSAESWLRRLLGGGVVLRLQLEARNPTLLADRGQIEQVLLNLSLNARDAMQGQGELCVETADDVISPLDADSHAPGVPAIRLTVRDTGAGIHPAILPNIFEPFFTTKPVGQGTGLGLSTVYGVVQQSGGTIVVDSQPGAGAAFIIRLPMVDAPADPVPAAGPHSVSEAAVRSSGTILLVEDFEPLRSLTAGVLRTCGYIVHAAADGIAALEHYAEHSDSIDLLVTDVMMPRMSGTALASEIRRKQPRARVLFLSGYAEEMQQRPGLDLGDSFYLQKPYAPEELIHTVQRLLKIGQTPA